MTKQTICQLVIAFIYTIFFMAAQVQSVTGRHPTGVNVNTNGVSTALITFHNLEQNEQPVDAFWCGDVTITGVVVGINPCVPGTLLGHLPEKFDFAKRNTLEDANTICQFPLDSGLCPNRKNSKAKRGSNNLAANNLTDVMTIPTAVIRRAYQEAQRGRSSEFFYIRQFINNGISTYVTVTCRMGGGGARTPLALTKVDLDFHDEVSHEKQRSLVTSEYRRSITLVKQNTNLPKFAAKISYNGSGLLKGRWEIVRPGDVEPSRFDLLSEASLSAETRQLQKRYRLISRFQKMLSPTGTVIIPGPDPKLLPTMENGLYRILFRIEASNDREGNSDTNLGILNTGGVAGFPMPTLRYFVGAKEQLKREKSYPPISLLLPKNNQSLPNEKIIFKWFDLQESTGVAIYKIEFYETTDSKKLIGSAFIKPGESSYKPADIFFTKLPKSFIWRVVAMGNKGQALSSSQLRELNQIL